MAVVAFVVFLLLYLTPCDPAAILAGDARTGVCIMRMEEGLDTGPLMLARELAIGER